MDAPTYPPAAAYVPPVNVPFEVSVREQPIGVLMAMPAVWAVVLKHLPSMQMMTSTPMIKPHLNNLTLADLIAFMRPATPNTLVTIDEELHQLPAADRMVP